MASAAKSTYGTIMARADLIVIHAGKIRRKSEARTKSVLLHAALANQVAAWDAYVKAVSTEYYSVTAHPAAIRYSAMHELLRSQLENELRKFNTPNSENCRNLLLRYTKFDPWPSWVGIRFNGGKITASLMTRNTLDEILKLRHSFAHGFSIPALSWNASSTGTATLDCRILRDTKLFLNQVCDKTDRDLSKHISTQHGIPAPW